jgi:hypothetical protein
LNDCKRDLTASLVGERPNGAVLGDAEHAHDSMKAQEETDKET